MPTNDELISQLLSNDEDVSSRATYLLDIIADEHGMIQLSRETIAFIKKTIRDSGAGIDFRIARILRHLHSVELIDEMRDHLNSWSDNENSTLWVLWTLEDLGKEAKRTQKAVAGCLLHPESEIRAAAIVTLSRIGPECEHGFNLIKECVVDESDSLVVFVGIRILLESCFKSNYLQFCRSMVDNFYHLMNSSEQELVLKLLNDTE